MIIRLAWQPRLYNLKQQPETAIRKCDEIYEHAIRNTAGRKRLIL